MYDHIFYKQVQISRSDIRPHIKWAVSLVILHMVTSIFLQGLCGYIWVNKLSGMKCFVMVQKPWVQNPVGRTYWCKIFLFKSDLHKNKLVVLILSDHELLNNVTNASQLITNSANYWLTVLNCWLLLILLKTVFTTSTAASVANGLVPLFLQFRLSVEINLCGEMHWKLDYRVDKISPKSTLFPKREARHNVAPGAHKNQVGFLWVI